MSGYEEKLYPGGAGITGESICGSKNGFGFQISDGNAGFYDFVRAVY
jgi:hypothetical protein